MLNINFQKFRHLILPLGFLLLLFAAACKDEPPPPIAAAQCNPIPVPPPALPVIVESITYQESEIQGPVHSLHVEGDRMYMGLGNSLAVMDVSDAAEPQLLGTLPLPGLAQFGLSIYSVQNGATGYFRVGLDDLIVDVSNPTNPVEVHCDPAVYYSFDRFIFDDRYIIHYGQEGGITITERSADGSKGREISTFAIYNGTPKLEWNQPPGQAIPLPHLVRPEPMRVPYFALDDRYAYLFNLAPGAEFSCCNSLTILDLENPAAPKNISTTVLPSEISPRSVITAEGFLFITFFGQNNLSRTTIYDIKDKEDPIELVTVRSDSPPKIHDGYAYFTNWSESKIDIWNLYGEAGPELVGQITEISTAFSLVRRNSLAFVGDYMYVADGGALDIFDNQDPANPYLVNQVEYPLLLVPSQLAVSNNQMAATISGEEGGVQTLEIEAGGQMGEWQSLSATNILERVLALTIVDEYLYTLDYEIVEENTITSLNVFGLDGTDEISPVASLSLSGVAASRLAAIPTHLFLLHPGRFPKIVIVDISDPLNPTAAGEVLLEPGDYLDLVVWESDLYLYTDGPNHGLWYFDISTPTQPQFRGDYPFPIPSLISITAADGFLFGLNGAHSVMVIGFHPSDGPTLVDEFFMTQGVPTDIVYENGILYLAMGQSGVAAVRLNLDVLGDSHLRK